MITGGQRSVLLSIDPTAVALTRQALGVHHQASRTMDERMMEVVKDIIFVSGLWSLTG